MKGRIVRSGSGLMLMLVAALIAGDLGESALVQPSLHAQTGPTTAAPEFKVISIRPSAVQTGRPRMAALPNGLLSVQGATLRDLIKGAYGLPRWPDSRIVGGPEWIRSDRFDIEAQAVGDFAPVPPEGGLPLGPQAMLRTILGERFLVKVRTETRDQPIYALARIREDALGLNLRPAKEDCIGPYVVPEVGKAIARCPFTAGAGLLKMGSATMDDLADTLAFFPVIDRVVQNRTGLSGRYDLELKFVAAFIEGGARGVVANPSSDSGGTLFTALQEQLGLKLEGATGPVSVVVVESAQKPTEN